MKRAQQIIYYLVANPSSSLSSIVAGVDTTGLEGHKAVTTVAAQLCQLIKVGKVSRAGRYRTARFSATATALVDGRGNRAVAAPRPAAKARKTPAKPKAHQQPVVKPEKQDAARAARPIAVLIPHISAPRHELTRQQLAADVAAFEAQGGRIEKLERGACSQFAYGAAGPHA